MSPEAFAARVPRLWRLAVRGAGEGIRRHGLLPTAEIVARAGLPAFAEPRRAPVPVTLPDGTPVTITDNRPLSFARLASILDDGLAPADWLAMLDARVFLWPDRSLGSGNLVARRRIGLESEWQCYDTMTLLAPVWALAEIAPINTGATLHVPPRRGPATFAPLSGLDLAEWRARRREAGAKKGLDDVKEVTVRGSMPSAGAALLEVDDA